MESITKKNFFFFSLVSFLFIVGLLQQDIATTTKIMLVSTMLFISSFSILGFDMFRCVKEMRYAAWGMISGVIFSTLFAILGGLGVTGYVVEGPIKFGFTGGLQHKNYFAVVMLICLTVFCFRDASIKNYRGDRALKIILGCMIFISSSRGAWIMTIVMLAVLHIDFFKTIKKSHRTIFYAICVLIGGFVVYLFYQTYLTQSTTYMIRVNGLQTYLDLYKDDAFHLWYGNAELGWKSGGTYVNNVRAIMGYEGTVEFSLVSIFVKNGILGLIGYVKRLT